MSTTVEGIISDVIRRETDKYTDNPLDRGGPTKYGITLKTLTAYRQKPCTAKDVELLEEPEAREIYYQKYVRDPGFAKIVDDKVVALLVDSGVLYGVKTATEWLQAAAKTPVDGQLGPYTADAANRMNPRELFIKVLTARFQKTARIVKRDPTQSVFIHGWINRSCEFLDYLV